MTMFRFGPLLAVAGAACLVAWTPEGRPPPPEVATLDRAPGSRFDAAPTETASVTRAAPPAIAAPPTLGDQSPSALFRRWRGDTGRGPERRSPAFV